MCNTRPSFLKMPGCVQSQQMMRVPGDQTFGPTLYSSHKKSLWAKEELPDKPAETKTILTEARKLGRQYPDVLQPRNAARGFSSKVQDKLGGIGVRHARITRHDDLIKAPQAATRGRRRKRTVYAIMMGNLGRDVALGLLNQVQEMKRLYPDQQESTNFESATTGLCHTVCKSFSTGRRETIS
ncbi:hypothetical protein GQ600_12398 [Phytophthora cactorum]|nr:hypothetical protein GQ600_12398 [Phytophthora cactorum]